MLTHKADELLGLTQVADAGRVNGAVPFPVPVSRQLADSLQSSPLSSLLGAAGIRSVLVLLTVHGLHVEVGSRPQQGV